MNINWTTLTAITGAALGVWNLVQGLQKDRVRLKVVPKLSVVRGNGILSTDRELNPNAFASIEVINLSTFPVTIAEVGFSLIKEPSRGVMIPDPPNLLPKRLEPRQSIEIRVTQEFGFPKKAKRAYATTQCDHTGYGDSPVLKKWRKASNV